MKTVAVLLLVCLVGESFAQLVLPPVGLGLGVPPLGLGIPPLGLGLGLPFGGLGLGLGFPFFPRFGFGGFGFGLGFRGLRRFGRAAEAQAEIAAVNRTVCRFEEPRSFIRCEGGHNLECEVEARFDEIRNLTVKLPSLRMFPDFVKVAGQKDIPIVRLISRVVGDATFIRPRDAKHITLSVYADKTVNEPGFFIKDARCFERVENVFEQSGFESFDFDFESQRQ